MIVYIISILLLLNHVGTISSMCGAPSVGCDTPEEGMRDSIECADSSTVQRLVNQFGQVELGDFEQLAEKQIEKYKAMSSRKCGNGGIRLINTVFGAVAVSASFVLAATASNVDTQSTLYKAMVVYIIGYGGVSGLANVLYALFNVSPYDHSRYITALGIKEFLKKKIADMRVAGNRQDVREDVNGAAV